jgi:hypothetical protein
MLLSKRASVPLLWCASSLLHTTNIKLTASTSSASSFLLVSAFSTPSRYHPGRRPCSAGHFQTTTTTTTRAMKRAGSPLSPYSSTTTRAASSSSLSSSSSTLVDTLLGGDSNNDKVAVVVSIPNALQLHGHPRVKFVDGSWFLSGRNGKEEYMIGPRIQDAIYFDINDIADTTTKPNLKHMMPSKELFASYMDAAGISNDDHVIVYGSKDCVRTYIE